MVEVTISNILTLEFNDVRKQLFSKVKTHEGLLHGDEEYMELLGYYPAIYSYMSELFVYLLNQVRLAPDTHTKGNYRVRRDMLEQLLKDIRLQYDSLSRKITVMRDEHDQTMRASP